ncbi:MAG TPA: GIY-YIG nuclease family protein [Luteimonas sp.]|nr:GIY-YIG nuclease family protein [Luteimonas sp.]HRO27376.1 GIY-YIG nuclease family protein [Luteimonas sp.]HRP72707.1 GIY-YIG nuclease family protein [Luteimonas sp.]
MAGTTSPSHDETGAAAGAWWLYLLECGDGSWYAGISNDLDARLRAHADGKGARYTRGRGPLRLIASRAYPDRAAASRAEWVLKRLPKGRKLGFFAKP